MKITRETVDEIMVHHFGKAPKEVFQMTGGFANFVCEALMDGDKYIVRIADEQSRLQFFIKEQWAVERALATKVPVPEILEVGNEASKYPYMIVRKVEGFRAENHEKRIEAIAEMGKYTAIINSIPTSGYGHVFDWSSNLLSRKDTWKEFLEKEMEVEKRLEIFEKHKIFAHSDGGMAKLKSAIKEISEWNYKPSLNHGDMRLKNVILNEKGRIIAILDWEACSSNIAPQWDVSIALHDLSIDEKDAFLSGYGISYQEYRNRTKGIKTINILNYAPFIELAYEEKDEKKKKAMIDTMRARLRGDLDLYSL